MPTVLIVEDDPQMLEVLTEAFSAAHYTFIVAADGEEALERVKESQVDLLVTDILMPEMDGLELINEIKKSNSDIKIIAITGGGYIGSTSYLKMAKSIGADEMLPKPFELDVLINKAKKLLEEK